MLYKKKFGIFPASLILNTQGINLIRHYHLKTHYVIFNKWQMQMREINNDKTHERTL